jgi:methylenetetrahydrofolate dehydrogenase (NADP+) / methenyltetrahydrofolate cyclohydrolase
VSSAPTAVLYGKELAASIRADATAWTASLADRGTPPRLAIVTATADESSAWYVRSLVKAAGQTGIECAVADLGPSARAEQIAGTLRRLSADLAVHGIILPTPLPEGTRLADLASAIDPAKDVDGANPLSLGRLVAGLPAFAPATASAVIELLDHYRVTIRGVRAVVVGRSAVVGKPVAQLLLNRDATVTVCHSRTPDLASVTREAHILVVAAGRAGLIGAGHIAPGAVVVDVGTNPTPDGGLTGDVAADAEAVAGAITPVPGGVGPVTTAVLLRHVTQAAGSS